jgi:hypothetical protein
MAGLVPPPAPVVSAVLAARRGLLALADRLVPAEVAVFEQSIGTAVTQSLAALVEIGVADALAEGPATAADLAARLDVDEDHLHRVLRAGAVLRLVKLSRDGRFALTRNGRVLASGAPDTVAPWLRYFALNSTTLAWSASPTPYAAAGRRSPRCTGRRCGRGSRSTRRRSARSPRPCGG